ncbi:MAG: hypothetical protein ACXVXZ_10510 [Mycobacteriaceae bacterium]
MRDLVERAWVLEQLPYVLEMWDLFRESPTPVAQADFLLQFANALTHLRWDFTGEFEEPPDN